MADDGGEGEGEHIGLGSNSLVFGLAPSTFSHTTHYTPPLGSDMSLSLSPLLGRGRGIRRGCRFRYSYLFHLCTLRDVMGCVLWKV